MHGEGMAAAENQLAEAFRQLPTAHALALRLRDAGSSVELIAQRLEIEPEAVGPLLAVAEAKLASILGATRPP